MTIQDLRNNNLIAYEYLRGSHMYGLNTPESDEDYGGVFICPRESLLGLRSSYKEQVSDAKSDIVFYEVGRWLELLLTANPTVLEGLFAPKECIRGEVHPVIQRIIDNRELFLSKKCFNTFYGYAKSQIEKARGLNKKIVNPIVERKDILDFCYTFNGQDSMPIKEVLADHCLNQKYCGLVNIPNMRNMYALFYDWAAYFTFEDPEKKNWEVFQWFCHNNWDSEQKVVDRMCNKEFLGYSGIVYPEDVERSNTVRLSSVPKGEKPIFYMSYNQDGYTTHCRKYKEYKEWEVKRNPVRYESNLGHNYDAKNVSHCMRLIRMAKELAKGEGFNVRRTWDREYLLDIKNHKFEYEEVMAQLETEKAEMEEAIKTSTLPESVDYQKINDLLINVRKEIYNI